MATLTAASPRARASTAQVWAALTTVYVVWGSTYLAIRVSVHPSGGAGLPPLLMAGVRFGLAGAVMLALTAGRPTADGQPDPLGYRQWAAAAVVGLALPAGGNGLVSIAEQHVVSAVAALVIATIPLWVSIITAARRAEPPTPREVTGLLLGFVGVAVLVAGHDGGPASLAAIVLLLLAALSWASGSVYARHAALPRRPLVGTGMQMLCGGAVLTLAGLLRGEVGEVHLGAVAPSAWVAFGYLIVIGSMVAYAAYVWLLANARLSLVTTYAYVNPAVAVALGAVFAGEPVTGRTLLATAVILAGVGIVVTSGGATTSEQPR